MFGKIRAPDLFSCDLNVLERLEDVLKMHCTCSVNCYVLSFKEEERVVWLVSEYCISGLHKSMVSSYLAEEKQRMAKIEASSFLQRFLLLHFQVLWKYESHHLY